MYVHTTAIKSARFFTIQNMLCWICRNLCGLFLQSCAVQNVKNSRMVALHCGIIYSVKEKPQQYAMHSDPESYFSFTDFSIVVWSLSAFSSLALQNMKSNHMLALFSRYVLCKGIGVNENSCVLMIVYIRFLSPMISK